MSPLRVAFLGLAHVHRRDHLDVIAEDPGSRLVAVWDPDPRRVDELPAEVGAVSPHAAVSVADLVVIDSMTSAHADLVQVAVTAGESGSVKRPVFVEKPLGRDRDEAERVGTAIEAAEVPFATGFFLRCLPALRRARESLLAGRLGELVGVRARFGHRGLSEGIFSGSTAWMLDRDKAGFGGFGDLGTHLIDVLLWLRAGHTLEVENARLAHAAGVGVDIGGSARLRWDDDVPATLEAGWDIHQGGLRIVIEGTVDTATVTDGTLALAGGPSWTAAGPAAGDALRAFIAGLRGRRVWETPGVRDAVMVARVLDDAYRLATTAPA